MLVYASSNPAKAAGWMNKTPTIKELAIIVTDDRETIKLTTKM